MTHPDHPEHPEHPSPWHAGERAMQQRLGVDERMAELGPRVIRDFMPDQHREFFEQLHFAVVGSVDDQGDAWATLLTGAPGFMRSPDPRTLTIAARAAHGDPASEGLADQRSIGLLAIEAPTRRRNRMNGTISGSSERGFEVGVVQSFGNCPKYIHPREFVATTHSRPATFETITGLDARARVQIAAADTFFVASYVDAQVDVSHRGGPIGFVQVEPNGSLTIPDYAGNRFFNTLGNILVQPKVGLLFVDFDTGERLQLSGDAELIEAGDARLASLRGAERAWSFQPRRCVRRDVHSS
ncbi:pyridoxamine 5'-phosphate oxidase family protein [Nannocystis sp.]|uniref:pyridoxamine 5'-phosphate oxidase family protein n=1 Tax=Nannocystis sp. TaxID=1962667 RepID=UPI0025E5B347|nr:pyridoxamine 5'-phosphate oxidase family protein [Nannocystis sp.]MBK7829457.1 pyridoxamine 5'-phosphate oxidase family protein [Nannocystis sp.]